MTVRIANQPREINNDKRIEEQNQPLETSGMSSQLEDLEWNVKSPGNQREPLRPLLFQPQPGGLDETDGRIRDQDRDDNAHGLRGDLACAMQETLVEVTFGIDMEQTPQNLEHFLRDLGRAFMYLAEHPNHEPDRKHALNGLKNGDSAQTEVPHKKTFGMFLHGQKGNTYSI